MTAATELPQILVIDDEMGPRESLRMLLKPNYQVHTADCVATGLKLLKDKKNDWPRSARPLPSLFMILAIHLLLFGATSNYSRAVSKNLRRTKAPARSKN